MRNKIDFFLDKLILAIIITLVLQSNQSQGLNPTGEFLSSMGYILILRGGLLEIVVIAAAISVACNILKHVGIAILNESKKTE